MSDTKSVEYIPTGTLGLPAQNNYFFNSSANIAPSYHVGPRTYSENGFVPHPLSYTGQPGPAPTDNQSDISPKTAKPGALETAPGGRATEIAWPHPYTINGQQPGR